MVEFNFAWIEMKLNSHWFKWIQSICIQYDSIRFNSTKFNSIEISIRTLTLLNPKENNNIFNSFHFNSNWIEMHWIQFTLYKFIQYNFHRKWNLISTKSTHFIFSINCHWYCEGAWSLSFIDKIFSAFEVCFHVGHE